MTEYMLTTIDNPFDPFTQYDEWRRYDVDHGYYTNEYLARIAVTSEDLPEEIANEEVNHALDEIISLNILGLYKKVTKDDFKDGKWKPYVLKEGEDY
jgi:hypothetical protein